MKNRKREYLFEKGVTWTQKLTWKTLLTSSSFTLKMNSCIHLSNRILHYDMLPSPTVVLVIATASGPRHFAPKKKNLSTWQSNLWVTSIGQQPLQPVLLTQEQHPTVYEPVWNSSYSRFPSTEKPRHQNDGGRRRGRGWRRGRLQHYGAQARWRRHREIQQHL